MKKQQVLKVKLRKCPLPLMDYGESRWYVTSIRSEDVTWLSNCVHRGLIPIGFSGKGMKQHSIGQSLEYPSARRRRIVLHHICLMMASITSLRQHLVQRLREKMYCLDIQPIDQNGLVCLTNPVRYMDMQKIKDYENGPLMGIIPILWMLGKNRISQFWTWRWGVFDLI